MFDTFKAPVTMMVIAVILLLLFTTKYYKSQYEEAHDQLVTLRQQYEELDRAASTCSENTDRLQKQALAKQAQVEEALQLARRESKKSNDYALKLLQTPVVTGDQCKDSISLFKGYMQNLKGDTE